MPACFAPRRLRRRRSALAQLFRNSRTAARRFVQCKRERRAVRPEAGWIAWGYWWPPTPPWRK
jgi:hypothetical protein